MRRMEQTIFALLAGAWLTAAIPLHAADWPQWRFDANRSAATEESCADNPAQLWHLPLAYPDPAYDHQYRMCADITYAPVAAHGLVFIPSNVADQVLACDLKTGRTVWRYIADGPVRMAPACIGETVCFGSDDGYLYAVAARTGELRWKVRGAPDHLPDSRLLVNGRLCSRWPVRGAPVIHGNAVFFGAGVWPEEGVHVSAVDVRTGELLWRSDKLSYIKNGMSDHGQAYDLSLPPQGYPAVLDGKLAVTSGRSLAAWFDLKTGSMEPYTCFYVKTSPPRGTWFVAGTGGYWFQGGHWFGTRPDSAPLLPEALKDAKSPLYWSRDNHANERYVMKERPFLGGDAIGGFGSENYYSEPVLTETTAYASEFASERKYFVLRGHTHVSIPTYDRIVARDLANPRWTSETQIHVRYNRQKVKMPRLVFPIQWELECPLKVLAKGGNRLYAGGKDTVAAIHIPSPGETPKIVWQRSVSGTPVNALIADETLVVTTHTGHVYAFGAGDPQPSPVASTTPEPGPYASPRGGFALLLGWGDGQRAKQLATDEDCRVVVFEADPAIAAEARNRLAEQGLYGRRIQVLNASIRDSHLTPHWANRLVINDLDSHGTDEEVLSAALDTLRPFTGRLELRSDVRQRAVLEGLLAKRKGYALHKDGETLLVHRPSAPDGADDWTHEPGGPENAFASSDRLVKWPLGLLWYSGDIDRYFTPATHFQHERNPYPLVSDGRMFLITGHYLHAVDIYTGMYLWKTEMPRTPWIETYYFDTRYYGRPTERHCALAHDLFYAVTGDKINAYDTATGELRTEIEVPARFHDVISGTRKTQEYQAQGHRGRIRPVPPWSEVRLHDDLLMAVFGKHLAALDRHSGDLRWSRESTRQTTAYAVGQETLYGVDFDLPARDRTGVEARSRLLFALDPATGRTLWETPVTSNPSPTSPPEKQRPASLAARCRARRGLQRETPASRAERQWQ
jgi:outer membrane protein assembly factor BamB